MLHRQIVKEHVPFLGLVAQIYEQISAFCYGQALLCQRLHFIAKPRHPHKPAAVGYIIELLIQQQPVEVGPRLGLVARRIGVALQKAADAAQQGAFRTGEFARGGLAATQARSLSAQSVHQAGQNVLWIYILPVALYGTLRVPYLGAEVHLVARHYLQRYRRTDALAPPVQAAGKGVGYRGVVGGVIGTGYRKEAGGA